MSKKGISRSTRHFGSIRYIKDRIRRNNPMKSFLEEYGIVIVVAIVILALIAVAVFFKTTGASSINGMLNRFMQAGGNTFNENA